MSIENWLKQAKVKENPKGKPLSFKEDLIEVYNLVKRREKDE